MTQTIDTNNMQKIHEMRTIRAKKNNAKRSRLRKRYGLILTAAESSFVESVYPGMNERGTSLSNT